VPLSWNNIRWNTGNLLFPGKIPEKQAGRITANYGVEKMIQADGSHVVSFLY